MFSVFLIQFFCLLMLNTHRICGWIIYHKIYFAFKLAVLAVSVSRVGQDISALVSQRFISRKIRTDTELQMSVTGEYKLDNY